ncbi:putative receptor protein kinase ZmPK1 [Cajanus cajan]|uniref:putative receptor protein kinase ZmPK1 n=1 Tax=Cajanus cajan TaxID=3821 RepID=UPI00098D8655|nr:putative receptor protein kinase ZmPK1 [Cajanus cajan]
MRLVLSTTLFLVSSLFSSQCSSSSSSLRKGSSLSVENPQDVLISPNRTFSAGFVGIGENAYSFAIWFTEPHFHAPNTATWIANRDHPVNGKRSKLSLTHSGNVVLVDASFNTVWSSNTVSFAPSELHLGDDGNLVLHDSRGTILWQSFDFPTDTLLPGQPLTRHTQLVSSRSESNHSSGFYKLLFDDENVLSLHYDGPSVSSSYWPKPWLLSWDVGRTYFNSSKIAAFDSLGLFNSSDNFTFVTSDYGAVLQRRLKLDCDGNVRVYSRMSVLEKWYVSWQGISNGCLVHGICGAYSTCGYDPMIGKTCLCLPGHRLNNFSDWSYGCEPMFDLTCDGNESSFLEMRGVELYGYDNHYVEVSNYSSCESLCLRDCTCKGFQYSYSDKKGFFRCYTKTQLLNGRRSPKFTGSTYLRLPKNSSFSVKQSAVETVHDHVCSVQLRRDYIKARVSHVATVFQWFATAFGALEMVSIFVVWFLIRTNQRTNADLQGYYLAATGFRKFSYSELKKATKGFRYEIGRGAGGVVYKGILSDQRNAAIKRLYNAKQGEGEFLAEVGIIGRLNHMNLIEMWGYCAEGKHRLLVYEYMENGSLAQNLASNTLDWSKRYKIALGMARVLAYLHEECLEWILHCDIKPQNILLDSNYQPKLADFGLSKLLNRNNPNNPSISMIRGTRGYMAPEWVFNLAITSKVDVYSYGIVVLEMITGKSPTTSVQNIDGEETYDGRLVAWVREKSSNTNASWVEQIIDPAVGPHYDSIKMEILIRVALNCVLEDKDSRPTMRQVVEVLQCHGSDH